MIGFPAGVVRVWPDFCLEIERELRFEDGLRYQLKGPNGSGKSSFISQMLIPALHKEDIWLLHFEQQTSLQLQAVKAWAAIFDPGVPVRDEDELVAYLLADLKKAWARVPKPVWIIADELHHLEAVQSLDLPHSLIYCAHHLELPHARILSFQPLDGQRSLLYA